MNGNESRIILQPRDKVLLSELQVFRFIDRDQAGRIAGFTSPSRAKQRLLALVRAGYLERFFLGTISGGRTAIYHLPRELRPRRTGRRFESSQSRQFIEHQLAINALHLGMNPHVRIWRRFSAPLPSAPPVIPDGYAELKLDGIVVRAFIEMDLGTESLPIWEKKVSGYLSLASSGYAPTHLDSPTFRVLVVASTEARIRAIRSVIAKHTDRVFWLADIQSIKREGIWSKVWRRPIDDQIRSLI
jgi:hypothetical protein